MKIVKYMYKPAAEVSPSARTRFTVSYNKLRKDGSH